MASAIFSTAAHAHRAADFLHGLQPVIKEPEQQKGVAAQVAASATKLSAGLTASPACF